jgi:hypothetical protein
MTPQNLSAPTNRAYLLDDRRASNKFFQIYARLYLVFHLRNAASQRGGGEGLRVQSQEGQDLCAAAAAGHLMFKTCTEDQTVDLTNKGMTKDSLRFSPWFHSAWRRTGLIL